LLQTKAKGLQLHNLHVTYLAYRLPIPRYRSVDQLPNEEIAASAGYHNPHTTEANCHFHVGVKQPVEPGIILQNHAGDAETALVDRISKM